MSFTRVRAVWEGLATDHGLEMKKKNSFNNDKHLLTVSIVASASYCPHFVFNNYSSLNNKF